MAKSVRREELQLDDTVKQNKRGEAILGRLYGPCADIVAPTRNGRFYSDELWTKVFEDDVVKEQLDAGGILGELDHPTDRSDTCMEKIAICMPEAPTKDKNGKLVATFDILDTPNGRIAYTLAKYGYKLGISSRGDGDVNENYDGTESVDPDTYSFKGFDLVLLPAVKSARLKMVESMNQPSFKKAICEALDRSNDSDRAIMENTLNNLKIDYKQNQETIAAENDGANVIKELQEALKQNKDLNNQIIALQEKLSVCYTKEAEYESTIQKYKSSVVNLSDTAKSVKQLKAENAKLQESLSKKDAQIESYKDRTMRLSKRRVESAEQTKSLQESISSKDAKYSKLLESYKLLKSSSEDEIASLNQRISKLQETSSTSKDQYSKKLDKCNQLVEHYKKVATTAVNKYIDMRAKALGISRNDIVNRLTENYTFSDIDAVCESLKEYRVSMNKLPVALNENKNVKYSVKQKREPILPEYSSIDDEVDDSLLELANNMLSK